MNVLITGSLENNLALDIACGNSVRRWSRRHGIDYQVAYEHSIQKPFRAIVDTTRLRIADRFVGKLTSAARLAVEQLSRLCTRSKSDSTRLAASRTLLSFWIKAHDHFSLACELTELEESAARQDERLRSGVWTPRLR